MKTRWLDRRIASPGPYLALCLSELEFRAACAYLKTEAPKNWVNDGADATMHTFDLDGKAACVVCLDGAEKHNPIEVAGLLIHEAVHVWQLYCDKIGEHSPGAEQEAYGIQSIAQELLSEFARRQS